MAVLRIAGLAVLWTLFVLSPVAGTLAPLGAPFQIDPAPDCQERDPDVATLPGVGFVSVWTGGADAEEPSVGQVYARIYGQDRNPLTGAFLVSDSGHPQAIPAVAAREDGRFLVVWWDATAAENRGRLFDASGAPLGGEIDLSDQQHGGEQIDIAVLPEGGFVAVWTAQGSVLMRRLNGNGQLIDPAEIVVAGYSSITGSSLRVLDPAVAVQPGGDLVVVWTLQDHGPFASASLVEGVKIPRHVPLQTPWTRLTLDSPHDRMTWGTTVGSDGDGNLVVAWREENQEARDNQLSVQLFDAAGQAKGPAFRADSASALWDRLGDPALLVAPGGSFLLAWDALPNTDNVSLPFAKSTIYGRFFNSQGVPQEPPSTGPLVISPNTDLDRVSPALAWAASGQAIAVWQEGTEPAPPTPAGCFSSGIGARLLALPVCLPGPGRLCLGDGRFQLETTWVAPFGQGTGPGQPVLVTPDTGYFWFFGEENVELMVKVLDGRAVNGHFWVFYGSLSNVAWRLRVTDLATGVVKNYDNPASRLASRGDTEAFSDASAGVGEGVVVQAFEDLALDREAFPAAGPGDLPAPALVSGPAPSHAPGGTEPGPCTEDPPFFPPTVLPWPGLCLNGKRFEVEVTWHDPFNGGSGIGEGVSLTDDSGYFWFFNPSNVELVVKILDGRTVNGKFWVFYGALTNVEYDIRVVRLSDGAEKTYHNPPFQFRSHADTAAFD